MVIRDPLNFIQTQLNSGRDLDIEIPTTVEGFEPE